VCSLAAEDHTSSATGQMGLDSPLASPLVEATMTDEEARFALGRSPPCATCGRICHFGFVSFLRGAGAHAYVHKRRGCDAEEQCNGGGHQGTQEDADRTEADDLRRASALSAHGVSHIHEIGAPDVDAGASGKRRGKKNVASIAQDLPIWASPACAHILCMEHAVLKVQQMVSEHGDEMASRKAVGRKKRHGARSEEEEAENEGADGEGNFDDAVMMLHMRYDDARMCDMATVAASKASEVKKGLAAAGIDEGKRAAAALTQHHISHHPTLKPPVAEPALPEAVSRALNNGVGDSLARRGGKKKRGRYW